MGREIMQSKLQKPQLPKNYVARPALHELLNRAPMILVSASAGSGKSTAVSAWIDYLEVPFMWYRLDSWDNHLDQFLIHLSAGMGKLLSENTSEAILELLNSRMSLGDEAVIRTAVALLQQVTSPIVWVFDDYQEVDLAGIHQFVSLLMQHLPQNHRVCLISREDPPVPLARYRSEGRLVAVREVDLRLSVAEARCLLDPRLDANQVSYLHGRTEGWIAGIQLTVQSLQGIENISQFMTAYRDSKAYIMDYLLEEVLERQSSEMRDFLLKTSIFDDFSPELVDYTLQLITGDCQLSLRQLVKSNCFIMPLIDGEWFRYHQLFRELLRQRLKLQMKTNQDELTGLYHRAGKWYEDRDQIQEAIHYYLEALPLEAARLIECLWSKMDLELRSEAWLSLAGRLPEHVRCKSPVLAVGWGWALLNKGDIQNSLPWFERAQALIGQDDLIIFDKGQYDQLPATLLSAKAYIAASQGHYMDLMNYNEQLIACATSLPYQRLWVIDTFVSTLHWASGDLEQAISEMTGVSIKAKDQLPPVVQGSLLWVIAAMQIEKGDLTAAQFALEHALGRLKTSPVNAILSANYSIYLGEIACLRGDMPQAFLALEQSAAYGQQYVFLDWRQTYEHLLARLYCSQGMFELARDSIKKGREYLQPNPIPVTISFDDLELWVQLLELETKQEQKSLNQRVQFFHDHLFSTVKGDPLNPTFFNKNEITPNQQPNTQHGLMDSGLPGYTDEFKWKLLMRFWTGSSTGLFQMCLAFLERAKSQKRWLHALEFTILAGRLASNEAKQQQYEQEARVLAQKEHLVMPFIIWGYQKWSTDRAIEYANLQLSEPLTPRELELLNLIAMGYSNEEICQALFLALSTVKSYNNSLFGKLGVKRRTEAIVKARVLKLLPEAK